LFAGAGNSWVQEILGGLMSRVSLLRCASLIRTDRLPRSIDEISTLLTCIQSRDAEGAREVSENYVKNAEVAALAIFEKQIEDLKQASPTKRKIA
jgi:DNA-binding GntR family transcriptional regulator